MADSQQDLSNKVTKHFRTLLKRCSGIKNFQYRIIRNGPSIANSLVEITDRRTGDVGQVDMNYSRIGAGPITGTDLDNALDHLSRVRFSQQWPAAKLNLG